MPARTPKNRIRQRGVAMVEGAVVMPVLCMFFVLNVYLMGVLDQKIYVQRKARENAFSYASNSCEGNPNGNGPSSDPGLSGYPSGGQAGQIGAGVQNKSGMVAMDLIGGSQSTVTSGFAYLGFANTHIQSVSSVLCNEELWGGDGPFSSLLGFFSLGLNMISGMFGFHIP
jgi:hypothetical protein